MSLIFFHRQQRSNLTELLVAALADGAYATAPDWLPGAKALCLVALSTALRRLSARCCVPDDSHVNSKSNNDHDGSARNDETLAATVAEAVAQHQQHLQQQRQQQQILVTEKGKAVSSSSSSSSSPSSISVDFRGGQEGPAREELPTPPASASASLAAAAVHLSVPVDTTGLPPPSRCREAWRRKRARARGAHAFCLKPREGLKLLQAEGVFCPGALDAAEVAEFLRTTPGLDKAAVGSYLGEAGVKDDSGGGSGADAAVVVAAFEPESGGTVSSRHDGQQLQQPHESVDSERHPEEDSAAAWGGGGGGEGGEAALANSGGGQASVKKIPGGVPRSSPAERGGGGGVDCGRPREKRRGVYLGDTAGFHAQVLEAFVETFDFRGQGLLTSLRMFLEAFRLPGEAQQIDRILHVSGWGGGCFFFESPSGL